MTAENNTEKALLVLNQLL